MILNAIVGTGSQSSIGHYQRPIEGAMPSFETPLDPGIVFAGIAGDN